MIILTGVLHSEYPNLKTRARIFSVIVNAPPKRGSLISISPDIFFFFFFFCILLKIYNLQPCFSMIF